MISDGRGQERSLKRLQWRFDGGTKAGVSTALIWEANQGQKSVKKALIFILSPL
jgi:hypothetical protein